MAIDPPQPSPERERLEELIAINRKRLKRADAKLLSAKHEHAEAEAALAQARARLKKWHVDNPDPQGSLI